jgi:hypothetical protein
MCRSTYYEEDTVTSRSHARLAAAAATKVQELAQLVAVPATNMEKRVVPLFKGGWLLKIMSLPGRIAIEQHTVHYWKQAKKASPSPLRLLSTPIESLARTRYTHDLHNCSSTPRHRTSINFQICCWLRSSSSAIAFLKSATLKSWKGATAKCTWKHTTTP